MLISIWDKESLAKDNIKQRKNDIKSAPFILENTAWLESEGRWNMEETYETASTAQMSIALKDEELHKSTTD